MSTVMQLEGVSKSFGGLKVIDEVSFSVPAGSRTALIGPNGAGKSTLFNLISGVYPIDSGRVSALGQNITNLSVANRVRHGIARSFQNIRLMPHLSTLENVMLGEHHRSRPWERVSSRKASERARQTLERAGLDTYPGQVVADLPYGIQKRIEVVRALMTEPKILLLDEPAAGLNSVETEELRRLLQTVSEGGVTLLVVEHDMPFVRHLCNHVVVLNFGRKIFEGTPEAVKQDAAVLEAYLGSPDAMERKHA
ncbi:MAG: ABC transporter ATP-binding protein [Betaproteobacteria bacterium]|nr:ABC transporter ATP-binding protein [Betaproteobacteria bacterium]